jgi:hypothetical protein
MITYSMNVMTQQNLEKELSFGQKKSEGIKSFDLGNLYFI